VTGATIGGLIGSLIRFDTDGISFVMTAMFVVIFMEQWMKEKHHVSAYIGLGVSVVCLVLFGADSFMVPTMVMIIALLAALRRPLEKMEVDGE
jgi:4-azaleucine resistance transporter AzlC